MLWAITIVAILCVFLFGVGVVILGRDIVSESKDLAGKLCGYLVMFCGALIIFTDGAAVRALFENLT